ncbi:GNAT family N-acetyltransferase [Streptomyces sp. NPDC001100]
MQTSERLPTVTAARQVWSRPDRLPYVLRSAFDGVEVSWHPPRPGPFAVAVPDGYTALRVPDPAGGALLLQRRTGRFTLPERARALLLSLLAHRPVLSEPRCRTVSLSGAGSVVLRPADRRDLMAVIALHALCAPSPRGALSGFPAREDLPGLLHPRVGHSLLAETVGGRPVGWGSLTWDGLGADAVVLAADAWRARGLVTVLLRALAETAEDTGCQVLWLYAAHGDDAAHRAVTGLGRPCTVAHTDAEATVFALHLAPTPADHTAVGLDALTTPR